ncbi:MAG: hypothetical protein R3D83_02175 [Caenibius sp.]
MAGAHYERIGGRDTDRRFADALAGMVVSREQELWAVALWVEKHHGENGWLHIAQQQDRLLAEGDLDGVAMWRKVGERFEVLQDRETPHGDS